MRGSFRRTPPGSASRGHYVAAAGFRGAGQPVPIRREQLREALDPRNGGVLAPSNPGSTFHRGTRAIITSTLRFVRGRGLNESSRTGEDDLRAGRPPGPREL